MKKKDTKHMLLTLCMVLALLPVVGFTARAAESTSQFNAIMDAAKDAPAGFQKDDDTNPYGYGKGEAFLLNEENELMLFQTSDLNKGGHAWTTWYNTYRPGTISDKGIAPGSMALAKDTSNDKGGFDYTNSYDPTPKDYCYVQAVAFDPNGTGRKDHVAYVGYLPPDTTSGASKPGVYVWVLNTVTKTQSAPVFLNNGLVVPDEFNQYQSGAILSITAGHYGGGTQEHFIVYSQGGEYGLREFAYKSGNVSAVQNRFGYRSFDGLHGQYVNGSAGKSLAASMSSDKMDKIGQRLYASLDTGDFNGDGVDDVAMVSYMGQPNENSFKNLPHEYYEPVLSIIYGDGEEIDDAANNQEITLLDNGARSTYLGDNGVLDKDNKRTYTSMVSPGIACGDINGDGEDEIVVAGYQNAIKSKANSDDAETPHKINSEKLQVTAYNDGNNDGDGDGFDQICFQPYTANGWTKGGLSTDDKIWQPVGMACVPIDGRGNEEYVFLSGDLGTVNSTGFATPHPTEYFKNNDQGAGGSGVNRAYLSSVVVGNFDDNEYGRKQVAFSIGLKQGGADDYYFKLGIAGGYKYGDDDKGGYGTPAQNVYSSDIDKDAYVIENKGDDHKEKLNCFLVAIDNDDTKGGEGNHNKGPSDGQLARYYGKSYAYSDPTVQAVLQAAPYFGELGSFDVFNNGSTSYSASNSYGLSYETTQDKSFGVGTTSEASMPGIKVGMERGYTASWSKSFEESFTETWADEFTTGAYDKVILQRTPVFIYLYEVFKDGKWTSAAIPSGTDPKDVAAQFNKNTIQVSIPKKPTYYTMSVGNYNEFVDFYNTQEGVQNGKVTALNVLDDGYLGSEGNPWGYRDDNWETTADGAEKLSQSNQSLSYDGGSATSTYEKEGSTTEGVSRSNGFEFGLTVSTGAMFGVGEAWGGVSTSFAYSDGYGKYESEATSTGTSGTVCNLNDPDGTVLRDYKFDWTFGTWNCNLGGAGETVPIFGYALSGLRAPVVPVGDLEAKIVSAGTVDLTWTQPAAIGGRPEATAYNVYRLNDDNEYVKLNQETLTTPGFTAENLDSNRSYTFVVTSLDEDSNEGIWSNEAVITTPKQNFPVSLTVDDDGAVSISAYHLGNKPIKDEDRVPEETIVYVEITPAEGSVITGVTLAMGGEEQNITTTDGKFNFALKDAASISVTTAPIATTDSLVSYQPRYAIAGLAEPPVIQQEEQPVEPKQEEQPVEPKQVAQPVEPKQEAQPVEPKQEEQPVEPKQVAQPVEPKQVAQMQATQSSETLLGTVSATVDGWELPSSGGKVIGAVEFTAHPEPGYVLKGWTIITEGQTDRTIVAAGKDTLTFYPYAAKHRIEAVFVDEIDPSVQRTVTIAPSKGGGSVVITDGQGQTLTPNANGEITILRGKQLVFSADAEIGYKLKSWTDAFSNYKNGAEPIELSVLEDMTVGADFFAPLKYPVTFSTVPMDASGGTLTAATADGAITTGVYLVPETMVDFTATANSGNRLQKWGFTVGVVETFKDLDDISGDLITTDNYSLPIRMNTDVKAYFKPIEELAVSISTPENGGITVTDSDENPVNNGDKKPYGSKLTITATANDGYRLSSLTVNGAAFTSGGSYALTGDIAIDAAFSKKSSGNNGGGSSGGGGGEVNSYALTFETNGGSAIDKVSKSSGAMVDLSDYLPARAGYNFAGWYSDKALTEKVTSLKLTKNTTIYAKWTKVIENPFDDMSDGMYYYDAVLWAVGNNVTSGTSMTAFAPDGICTRAQTVTFLWRAMGSPKPTSAANPFTDVSADAYYYQAVLWAVEKGVTKGTSEITFSPNMNCTRAQVVTLLYRAAGSPAVAASAAFTDVAANAYYAKAVTWAIKAEITKGTSTTTFSPNAECTRAQIVTFLYRYLGK